MSGNQVDGSRCIDGHSALGNAEVWAPRIARGIDAVLFSAFDGKGAMPARAGGDCLEVEIARAGDLHGQCGRQ